jgi:hypothetical protein
MDLYKSILNITLSGLLYFTGMLLMISGASACLYGQHHADGACESDQEGVSDKAQCMVSEFNEWLLNI